MRIDLGIACNKNQDHKWWSALWPETLRLERMGRVKLGQMWPIGSALTDYNRNKVVEFFEAPPGVPKADALWFVDDDTVPPMGALEHLADLLAAGAGDIVAGVYYARNDIHNPIAYKRQPGMGYVALGKFQPGEIVAVDSVGMGCTLIHRRVFEGIREQYRVFRRLRSGTVFPIHQEDVWDVVEHQHGLDDVAGIETLHAAAGKAVIGPGGRGYFVDPIEGPVADFERWPFFAFEYGRTEDHPFCEMAKRCGFKIVVDTAIECRHVGAHDWGAEHFQESMDAYNSWRRLMFEMGG